MNTQGDTYHLRVLAWWCLFFFEDQSHFFLRHPSQIWKAKVYLEDPCCLSTFSISYTLARIPERIDDGYYYSFGFLACWCDASSLCSPCALLTIVICTILIAILRLQKWSKRPVKKTCWYTLVFGLIIQNKVQKTLGSAPTIVLAWALTIEQRQRACKRRGMFDWSIPGRDVSYSHHEKKFFHLFSPSSSKELPTSADT